MIKKLMLHLSKIIFSLFLLEIFIFNSVFAYSNSDFESWLISYKKSALKKGITQQTIGSK